MGIGPTGVNPAEGPETLAARAFAVPVAGGQVTEIAKAGRA